MQPILAATKDVDDDDVIYLSSDEEDLAPKSKPPFPIQRKHIACEDDDDVVILSGTNGKLPPLKYFHTCFSFR